MVGESIFISDVFREYFILNQLKPSLEKEMEGSKCPVAIWIFLCHGFKLTSLKFVAYYNVYK